MTASCAVTPPPVPAEHAAPKATAPSGLDGILVAASLDETAAVPAPLAAPIEDHGVDPACGGDLQPICDAYRRALSAAYVTAKLALLQAAMADEEVRQVRGCFLAALDRDWTEQPRPADRRGQQDTAPQDPALIPPDDTHLITGLTGVGVTPETAARLVRDNPDGARRPPGRRRTGGGAPARDICEHSDQGN